MLLRKEKICSESMEGSSSLKIVGRKRKKASPSAPNSDSLTGVLTRRRSQIHCRRNRSGMLRSGPVPGEPFRGIQSVKHFLNTIRIDASRGSSVKDLRMHRVFTPDITSVIPKEEEEYKAEKELLTRSSDTAHDSSPDSDLGAGDAEGGELGRSRENLLESRDEPEGSKIGVDAKICSGEISFSENKMAVNKLVRKKVFKTPSSFSYRRLLPHLMDILNDDDPSVSKVELVDGGISRELQKLDSVISDTPPKNLDVASPLENGEVEKLHEERLFMATCELDQAKEIMGPVEVKILCNGKGVNGVDTTAEEECDQMTPPELDFIAKGFGNCGDSTESVQAENQEFKGLSNGSERNSKPDNPNRLVLNPCSQLRLFKNPGSVSYRRLLPFLMDICKDNTCSGITQSPVALVDSQEELQTVSSPTAKQSEKHNIESGMQNSSPFPTPLQPLSDLVPCTSARLSSSMLNYTSNVDPNLISSQTPNDPCGVNDTKMEETIKSQITPRKLESDFDRESSNPLPPPSSIENDDTLSKESTFEKSTTVAKPTRQSCAELEFQNNNEDLVCRIDSNQNLPLSKIPNTGPSKGILKRNRLGCRGLCTCLACSSFRLNADRAFEFSQNQMHDAEEVASVLMKELANLGNMLQKSVIIENGLITSGLSTSQLNPAAIKEACDRAIEAENLVKERLSQMKYDLNVHCRIPDLMPPRVYFSNCIQERTLVLDPCGTEKKARVN
ncbi:uncharacterized protein LOC127249018 isoform X2 [Andrographis paniculata]|uniref:uncharacterized protein LOC127249018 isoform X2 n=1 Tax=Andrographis paniculata TaxID=175694 RepID=UPI0021E7D6EA|nr:uncharacterized protein LOC127249018 isoform X2 [Andrographis paniculata]